MHSVVQDWCLDIISTNTNVNLIQLNELALIFVGYTVPRTSPRNHLKLQQRLIPHANHVRRGGLSGRNIAAWRACHSD
jgi:hypothetical protein